MKKFGFTLAELLVSLTVIAIAATMMASLSGNLMPDKNKVKVLKFHSAISNALESMFNNENLYNPGQRIEGNQVVASCEGVECFYGDNNDFNNFRNLLIARVPQSFMGGTWDIEQVNDDYIITYSEDPTETGSKTKTQLTVCENGTVFLDRRGDLNSRLVITEGERNNCLYAIPQGSMTLGIYGKEVKSNMTDHGGTVKMVYSIDMNLTPLSENKVEIFVEER